MKKKSGSVLIFTLMILAVIVVLTEQLIKGVFVGSQFTKTMVYREHAEMLALGGVTLAIAQLTINPDDKDQENKTQKSTEDKEDEKPDEKKDEKKNSKKDIKKFLKNVIPTLNRWQEFVLKQPIDGIDGIIKICVTCENGKININEAFDFKKQEFKPDMQELLKRLEIPHMLPAGEIYNRFTEFFKKRNRKLDDITELSEIPGINRLNIFYNPPEKARDNKSGNQAGKKIKKSEPNKDITLQDLFTTWTDDGTVNPLWFSDSMCAVLSLRRPLADDVKHRQEKNKQFVETFKEEMVQDWDANWKTLENLYEEKPKVLPEIKKIFSKEFWPKVFSVLSYGKVGHVEQIVLAVIKEVNVKEVEKEVEETSEQDDKNRDKKEETQRSEDKDKKPSEQAKIFKILKIYWI